MRAAAAAVAGAEDAETAARAGGAAVLAEAGWSGTAEPQAAVAAAFAPVARALWSSGRDGTGDDPMAALAEFEAWYAGARGGDFLALMEREVVELPLVEF